MAIETFDLLHEVPGEVAELFLTPRGNDFRVQISRPDELVLSAVRLRLN